MRRRSTHPVRRASGRAFAAACLLSIAPLASGCFTAAAVGAIAGASRGGGGGGGGGGALPAPTGPVAALASAPAIAGGDIEIALRLIDAEGRPTDLLVEVSVDGGPFAPATEATALGSDGIEDLPSSSEGELTTFIWNSFADTLAENVDVLVRVSTFESASGLEGNHLDIPIAVRNAFVQSPITVEALDPNAFTLPFGIAVEEGPGGEVAAVILADPEQHRVWRFDVGTGELVPIAGTGFPGFTGDNLPATSAALSSPQGVALDAAGNLFIADSGNGRVRRVSKATGFITTVAGGSTGEGGDGGLPTAVRLQTPAGIALDGDGNLYITESAGRRVRAVNRTAQAIVVGGVTIDPATIETVVLFDEKLDIALPGGNEDLGELFRVEPLGIAVRGQATGSQSTSDVEVYVADRNDGTIFRVRNPDPLVPSEVPVVVIKGKLDGGLNGRIVSPIGLAIDEDATGVRLVVADQGASTIVEVCLYDALGAECHEDPTVVLAGIRGKAGLTGDGGKATEAELNRPFGVALGETSGVSVLVIADTFNQVLRAVNRSATTSIELAGIPIPPESIQTVAGALAEDPSGEAPAILVPASVLLLPDEAVLVTDFLGGSLLKIDPLTRAISTVATGFDQPLGLALEPPAPGEAPRFVALCEAGAHRVLKVPLDLSSPIDRETILQTMPELVIAGTGIATGSIDGDVTGGESSEDDLGDGLSAVSSTLNTPAAVSYQVLDAQTKSFRIFIADGLNHRVRVVDEAGVMHTYVNDRTSSSGGSGVRPVGGFDGDGPRLTTGLLVPLGVLVDEAAGRLLIADSENHLVREVALEDPSGAPTAQVVTIVGLIDVDETVAGYNGDNRPALGASLDTPVFLLLDGPRLSISDQQNHRVRQVEGGLIFTITGTGLGGFNGDGLPPENTSLQEPTGLAIGPSGALYIADSANLRLRRHKP